MLANHPNVLSGGGVATNIIGGTGLFADGTVAAPSISFLADQDTGIYRIGTNNIGIAAGGVKAAEISADGFAATRVLEVKNSDYVNGSFGSKFQIALLASTGETSTKLEAYTVGATSGGVLNINTGGGGAVNFGSGNVTFGGNIILPLNGFIGKSASFALQFGGSDYGFVNTSSGYCVVFSNSAPTNSLVIASSGAATFAGAVVAPSLTAPASTALALAAGSGNQNITLTPSGTGGVGIGTAAPGKKLDVNGTAQVRGILTIGESNVSDGQISVDGASGNLGFQINGTTKMYLNSSGSLLIGTTVDSGALLQVGTNTSTSAGGMVFGTDTFLFRSATGVLRQYVSGSNNPTLIIGNVNSGALGAFQMTSSTNVNINAAAASGSITLQTNSGTTALTLDASQNATFAGAVTSAGLNQLDVTNALGRALIVGPVAQTGGNLPYASVKWGGGDFGLAIENTNAVAGQGLGLRIIAGSAANDLPIYVRDRTNATTLFSVSGTGAATFAGAIKLANAYVGIPVVSTGYVTIQDNTGTTYKIAVSL